MNKIYGIKKMMNLEVTKQILAQNGHYKPSTKLEVFRPCLNKPQMFPLYSSKVSAGFPSPADDNLEKTLDLNSYLIKRPAATFFVRVNGDSMINAGINDNDILVVDRSIKPSHGKVIIAVLDGQMTVKRLHKRSGKVILMPENDLYKPIEIQSHISMEIWGVVTSSVHFL
ncbi:translesion error-prone DNA polymerase V autoproteolytic subunit [Alphaproteobacteria bacterium]|jgi:DNA polymerase V|nr:translesion error-prone DNA polymerase V autoproteolytic subunit [Alphaproteobacteria bacterium]